MAAKAFSTMQTNVGNMVGDTSSAMKTKIGVWINDAYQDAWNRCMWTELIDEDFTFESVVDQADYSFSSDMSITDFGEEVFVADIANGHELERWTIRDWYKERSPDYSADALDSGNPVRYIILPEAGKLRLDPPPDTAETYAMPYKKTVTDLSSSGTPSMTRISMYLEKYATAQALAYKKEYQKSSWFMTEAERELAKIVRDEYSKFNQRYYKIIPNTRIGKIWRMTGDKSYDSI